MHTFIAIIKIYFLIIWINMHIHLLFFSVVSTFDTISCCCIIHFYIILLSRNATYLQRSVLSDVKTYILYYCSLRLGANLFFNKDLISLNNFNYFTQFNFVFLTQFEWVVCRASTLHISDPPPIYSLRVLTTQ